MPKVITFTANLLAETTYEFSSWAEGKAARAQRESFQVGGKGINVSKMLDRLGADNRALCFPGGSWGPMCERWLAQAGLRTLAFPSGCVTRSGAVVRSAEQEETTFLGIDSVVSEEAVRDAVAALEQMDEPSVFAICGSVQGWSDASWDALRDWIQRRGEGIRLVVDNYGESLKWFAEQGPDLIKINRDELESLVEQGDRSEPTDALLRCVEERFACARWVVTDGGNPLWVMKRGEEPQSFAPPTVECVSPTGSGDVVFATLIDCLYNRDEYGLLEASQLAADYASRSAAMPGIAEFEL